MTIQQNSKNKLSIQLGLSGFSFLIYPPQEQNNLTEKEILYEGDVPFHDWLKVKFAAEDDFHQKHQSSRILFAPEKYTIVPNKLFDTKQVETLFSVTHPLFDSEEILHKSHEEHTVLFAILKQTNSLLKSYFPKVKLKSIPSFLLENTKSAKQWNIGILILYNRIYVTVSKDNQLMLNNSFQFQTKEDLLYYALYLFDNLEIPVAESSVQLFGHRAYSDLLKTELNRYHNDISIPTECFGLATKTPLGNLLLSNI